MKIIILTSRPNPFIAPIDILILLDVKKKLQIDKNVKKNS